MKFLVEWIPDAQNKSPEERATLCEFRIRVDNIFVSAHLDSRTNESCDALTLPIAHLAEGIATNWWAIFGARDLVHSVLPWRMGFALPDLRFECDGSTFLIQTQPLQSQNPPLVFWQSAEEHVSRQKIENELADFLDFVTAKLGKEGQSDTEVQLAWSRVVDSRSDQNETIFCTAAGALGVDPYAISEADTAFIEEAGKYFSGETLFEFLADVRAREEKAPSSERRDLIDWLANWRPKYDSALPELGAVAEQLYETVSSVAQRPPWAIGHHAARAFRETIGLEERVPCSRALIAKKLGTRLFKRAKGPAALHAVVAREDQHIHIHLRLRGSKTWDRNPESFAFARAIGDAVCFRDAHLSTINGLHRAKRQAVGRAFAAEVLAPRETVIEMRNEGRDIEEIAGSLEVNTKIVEHQIENAPLQHPSMHWALGSAI